MQWDDIELDAHEGNDLDEDADQYDTNEDSELDPAVEAAYHASSIEIGGRRRGAPMTRGESVGSGGRGLASVEIVCDVGSGWKPMSNRRS